MAEYCFKCPDCSYTVVQDHRDPAPTCNHAEAAFFLSGAGANIPPERVMNRDWKAEGVMVDKTAFNPHGNGTPANPGGIRKKLVSGNVPDPW